MEITTLNTHSLAEPKYEFKLAASTGSLAQIKPDIITLQEVSQSRNAPPAISGWSWKPDYVPCCAKDLNTVSPCAPRAAIRADNHVLNLTLLLARAGVSYQWTWTPAEVGYGVYDEGPAALSRSPILGINQLYITGIRDYEDWKIREMLGISTRAEYGNEYFYSVHIGWWNDNEKPFEGQWNRISNDLSPLVEERLWLMGNFNSPVHIIGQGRDLILTSGWFDAYDLATPRDLGVIAASTIDGWRGQGEIPGMRTDYIWTSRRVPVISSRTMYDGTSSPIASDHFGIIIEY